METNAPQPKQPKIKVVRTLRTRSWVRILIIFLLGFLAGYILFVMSHKETETIQSPLPVKQESAKKIQKADSLQLAGQLHYESPLAKGVCNVRYTAKTVEVTVELSSLYPVKSVIAFDVNNFVVLNLRNVNVNDQSTTMTAGNFVQFNSVGDNKYIIELSNENMLPNKIKFTLAQNDVTIYQNVVEVNNE